MTEKTLTTENIKPALDALRGELAPWPVVAKKQDKLNGTQKAAINSGITSGLVAQIGANTAAIRALESAITGTGLRALVVATLPAVGTTGILYIVPVTTYDPETDADVVNYSNEYIWIPVEAGQASEGHYEQVGQTGIVINNGQLTITVNGTSVGTFTANQSGDTTAAITVPTNADYVDKTTAQTAAGVKTFSDGIVSNVTGNVTGNLTGTASRAIADEDGNTISSTYGKLAGSQTWTGTNTFRNINPETNSTYSLGTSSYQWSAVYAQTYYYNGTEFQSKFVTTDTEQSITNLKTITTAGSPQLRVKSSSLDLTNTTITSYRTISIRAIDKNDTTLGQISWNYKASDNTGRLYLVQTSRDAVPGGIIIQHNGSDSTTDIMPYDTTNAHNLGTSTNQWKSVYSQTYYYNGTAWGLDKENVWSQSQITTGVFSIKNTSLEKGVIPASTTQKSYYFADKNGLTVGVIRRRTSTTGAGSMRVYGASLFKNGQLDPTGTEFTWGFGQYLNPDGTTYFSFDGLIANSVTPTVTNTYDLGTSTNKWKTLNGINPGALSLPDFTSETGVSLSAGTNTYTPTFSGWLSISTTGDISVVCGNFCHKATDMISVPVIAGKTYTVTMPSSATGYFYPCLGNV